MRDEQTNRPPHTLDGAGVVCFASIASIDSSGGTTHRVNGEVPQGFAHLAIAKYPGDDSFYLFYCDISWEVVTDTNHSTLDAAKHQAHFEFPGVNETWTELSNSN